MLSPHRPRHSAYSVITSDEHDDTQERSYTYTDTHDAQEQDDTYTHEADDTSTHDTHVLDVDTHDDTHDTASIDTSTAPSTHATPKEIDRRTSTGGLVALM